MSRAKAPEAPAPVAAPRRRRSWRPWLVALGVIILVVAALGGTYAWTQTQYFVGKAGANVAIYRGVNTEFGPLKFFNVYRVSNLPVANLQPSYRGQVEGGITAHSKKEAESIVQNLRDQQLPGCLQPASSTTAAAVSPPTSPAGKASTSPVPTTSPVAPASPSHTRAPCPVPT